MNPFGRACRSFLATPLTLLMTALSVAVPALDRDRSAPGPVIESEHSPSACLTGHDHRVCTHVGMNPPTAPVRIRSRVPEKDLREVASPVTAPPLTASLTRAHGPRAPPVF